MNRLLLAIVITLCSGAAIAVDSETTGEASASELHPAPVLEKQDNDDEMVCKRVRVTGTHFKQRVCRTRGQMRADREAAQRQVNQADRYKEGVRSAGSPAG